MAAFSSEVVLFSLLVSSLVLASTGSSLPPWKDFRQRQFRRAQGNWISQHDIFYPPITAIPTAPVFNPVTTPATIPAPPVTPAPAIITVPSAIPITVAPVTIPPINPQPNPVTAIPGGIPVTAIPGGIPVTNPVNTYPTNPPGGVPVTIPVTIPVVTPPMTGNTPAVPGQSWCVVRSGASEAALQAALDYACGIGGADCSAIQFGSSCFYPDSLQTHASFAFNNYYQKNPVQTSCDFGGNAVITSINPSSGSCIFTASPATASPITTIPIPTPTTESSSGATSTGSGTPPAVFNSGNPGFGGGITGYGGTPSIDNSSSFSTSSRLKPFIDFIVLAMVVVAGRIGFHI